jgi:hypothetical protein
VSELVSFLLLFRPSHSARRLVRWVAPLTKCQKKFFPQHRGLFVSLFLVTAFTPCLQFAGRSDFQQEACSRLDRIMVTLLEAGFRMDKDKTEVAWFFANERPRVPSLAKAKELQLDWNGVKHKFDIKAKPVRWLGLFLDCRMNWQAHVKHRLALGHHRIRTMARIMNANGIKRKLARWSIAMSTAAYGIEAIWEGQT